MISLPRRARDKHRECTQKRGRPLCLKKRATTLSQKTQAVATMDAAVKAGESDALIYEYCSIVWWEFKSRCDAQVGRFSWGSEWFGPTCRLSCRPIPGRSTTRARSSCRYGSDLIWTHAYIYIYNCNANDLSFSFSTFNLCSSSNDDVARFESLNWHFNELSFKL